MRMVLLRVRGGGGGKVSTQEEGNVRLLLLARRLSFHSPVFERRNHNVYVGAAVNSAHGGRGGDFLVEHLCGFRVRTEGHSR